MIKVKNSLFFDKYGHELNNYKIDNPNRSNV